MQLIKPGDRKVIRHSPQARRKDVAPKSDWRCVRLACGHFTTSDHAALALLTSELKDTYWCDTCQAESPSVDIGGWPKQPDKPPF